MKTWAEKAAERIGEPLAEHLFAAVLRIADQPLALRIDDPVHQLRGTIEMV